MFALWGPKTVIDPCGAPWFAQAPVIPPARRDPERHPPNRMSSGTAAET